MDDTFEGKLAGRGFDHLCTVPDILRELPSDAHRAALNKALDAPVSEVPTSRIERALRDQKIPVSRPKLDDHRGGRCECRKSKT